MAEISLPVSCVYAIRNTLNDKRYVGSTTNTVRRRRDHLLRLKNGSHGNPHVRAASLRYGPDAFVFEVLEAVDDISALLEREQYWIDKFCATDPKRGYNLRPNASNNGGIRHDLITRAKIGATLSAYLQRPEVKAKMSAIRAGTRRSETTREKLRRALEKARAALHSDPDWMARVSETKRRRRLEGLYTASDLQRKAAAEIGRRNAGSAHGAAKLNERQVLDIRASFATGTSIRELASRFGMSIQQTRDIATMKAWKHVGLTVQEGVQSLGSMDNGIGQ